MQVSAIPFNDGRNLIYSIIDQIWSPAQTIYSVAIQLPSFVDSVSAYEIRNETKLYGDFCCGRNVSATDYKAKLYKAKSDHAVVLTPSAIIFLTKADSLQFDKQYIVESWAHLQALHCVKRYTNAKNKITFLFKTTQDNQEPEELTIELLDSSIELIQTLIAYCKLIEMGVTIIPKAKLIKEEEIKPSTATDIDGILMMLTIKQSEYDVHPTEEISSQICSLYQDAIQYYSGVGDPLFEQYVLQLKEHLKKKEELKK